MTATATKQQAKKAAPPVRSSEFSIGDRAVFLTIHFSRFGNRRYVPKSKVTATPRPACTA